MKTQKEFEENLYKRNFTDRIRNNAISNGMVILLALGIFTDIIGRINHNANHYEGAALIVGYFFPVIYLCIVTYFLLFRPLDILKEKEKLRKQLKELKKEKDSIRTALEEKFKKIDPEDEKQLNEIQEKIWNLEFQFKMLGGNTEKE